MGARVPCTVVSTQAPARPARARLGRWPFDDEVVHLVLLDHQMVPTSDDIAGWTQEAIDSGARAVRTGALFPASVPPFLEAGFGTIDTLALLTHDLRGTVAAPSSEAPVRVRRLRPSMLDEAAAIDCRAFSEPWANDASALADIMSATPQHRSRSVHVGRRMVAFSISGRADRIGYVQRLAVDPSARREGLARLLLVDALDWMRRRSVDQAMVNTASNNRAALSLYTTMGFSALPQSLLILERGLR